MRHPTLALVLLSFAAGSLLHCELGVPADADDIRTINSGCVPVGGVSSDVVADVRDSRIRPGTVASVYICRTRCESDDDCSCPISATACTLEGPQVWCTTPVQYSVTDGRLVAPCGTTHSEHERFARVLLR